MRIAISLVLASLTGCFLHGNHDPADGDVPPTTTPPLPPTPTASGTYQVRSQIDVTVEVILPAQAEAMVATLRDFSTAPAHTLIDLAEDAGVPAVAELRAALPDVLESKLEGWIDGEIAKLTIGGVPVTQLAAETAALAETSLTQIALDSELVIAGGAATHRLTTLDFTAAGLDTKLPLGGLPGDLVTATTTATVVRGELALGDHRFGLAYGAYAWRALESACTKSYGHSIRETLGTAVDCPALASRIASKCVLGVCVGHASQLTALCERGLDEVVALAEDKVTAMKLDALHFAEGSATVVDRGDRLAAGTWTAELNAGMGLRQVPATFTAAR